MKKRMKIYSTDMRKMVFNKKIVNGKTLQFNKCVKVCYSTMNFTKE